MESKPLLAGPANDKIWQGRTQNSIAGNGEDNIPDAVVVGGVYGSTPLGGGAPQQQHMCPDSYHGPGGSGVQALSQCKSVVVKQKFQRVESLLQAFGLGCCEQANEYTVYDFHTGEQLMDVYEDSGVLCRSCCHPHHRLSLRYVDVRSGVAPSTTAMRSVHPFKCACCAVFNICRPEIYLELPDGSRFQQARTPCLSGCLHPELEILNRDGTVNGTLSGPGCCLGGLVEVCLDSEFNFWQGMSKTGKIVKTQPQNLHGRLLQVAGDADTYTIEFPLNATTAQKAGLLASSLLVDYLYFERGPPVQCNLFDRSCSCFCMGCVIPCNCERGGSNSHAHRHAYRRF